MKKVLEFGLNIILYVTYSFTNLFLIICWFGKLPKVSVYHQITGDFDQNEIFNKKEIQYEKYQRIDINNFVNELIDDKRICDVTLDLIDHKGEKYGEQSLVSYIRDKASNHVNKS